MARTDEAKWKRIVASVKAGGKGGDPGQWSARKAQLLPLVQWPDLDSHLNLVDDPFPGPPLEGDRLRAGVHPGLGGGLRPGSQLARDFDARS